MTDPRLANFLTIIKFFKENPVEQEICGTKKKDALYLVQSHLRELGTRNPNGEFQDLANIDLVSNLNFTVKTGEQFKKTFDDYIKALGRAERALNDEQGLINSKQPSDKTTVVSLPGNIPTNLHEIVANFESDLQQAAAAHPNPDKQWWNMVSNRHFIWRRRWEDEDFDPQNKNSKTKGEILSDQLEIARVQEAQQRKNQYLSDNLRSQKIRLTESIIDSFKKAAAETQTVYIDKEDVHKIFTDIIDFEQEEEETLWREQTLMLGDSSNRHGFTQEEREKRVKKTYQEKLQEKIAEHLKHSTDFISEDQIKTEASDLSREMVENLDSKSLVNVSFVKHIQNIAALDPKQRREELYGLMFGRMLGEAEMACQHVTHREKEKLIGEAVFEAYEDLRFHKKFEELTRETINQTIEKRLRQKFGRRRIQPLFRRRQEITSEIVFNPALDLSVEISTLSSDNTQEVLDQTAGQYGGKYQIPIPGLVFLDHLSRTEIVGNAELYQSLKKTNNLNDAIALFKKTYAQKNPEVISNYQKEIVFFQQQIQLDPNKKSEYEEAIRQRELWINNPSKMPDQFLFNVFHLQHIGKSLTPEEESLFRLYLQNYQKISKSKLGWLVHKSAYWHSLQETNLPSKGLGKILGPFGQVFRLPNMQLWAYSKAFLSNSFSDPSIAPYALAFFVKQYITGSVSFYIKSQFCALIERGFSGLRNRVFNRFGRNTIGSKIAEKGLDFFQSLIFIRHNGVSIITIFHPIQAAEAVFDFVWRTTAQHLVDKTILWMGRVWGTEAVNIFFTKVLGAGGAILGIPIIGTLIGAILTIAPFIWDFIIPDWVKKGIKLIFAGITLGLFWILQYLIGFGGMIGGLLGSLIGLAFGGGGFLIGGAIGTVIGMAAGSVWYFLTGSAAWAPGWIVSLFPGWAGIGGSISNLFGGILNGISGALSPGVALAAPAVNAVVTVSLAGIGGVVVYTGFVAMPLLQMALWTPISPQGVPGGMVAENFQVEKTVIPVNSQFCPNFNADHHCENDVIIQNQAKFKYSVKITIKPGVQISNFLVKDTITVLSQGPNPIPSPPVIKKYEFFPKTGEAKATAEGILELEYEIDINGKDDKGDPICLNCQNSVVMNLVTVEANGEKATNGTSFFIGTPPPSDCPLENGRISAGSLGGKHENQHGLDSYWNYVEAVLKGTRCSYAIPWMTQTNGPSLSIPGATYCTGKSPLGTDYGFAVDVAPVPLKNDTVRFPSVEGETLDWKYESHGPNGTNWGYLAYYHAQGKEYYYRILVIHIRESDINTKGGLSGEFLGTLCDKERKECNMGKHLHVELTRQKNGITKSLRPEFLCDYSVPEENQ